jgi:hypothetical protein
VLVMDVRKLSNSSIAFPQSAINFKTLHEVGLDYI